MHILVWTIGVCIHMVESFQAWIQGFEADFPFP